MEKRASLENPGNIDVIPATSAHQRAAAVYTIEANSGDNENYRQGMYRVLWKKYFPNPLQSIPLLHIAVRIIILNVIRVYSRPHWLAIQAILAWEKHNFS